MGSNFFQVSGTFPVQLLPTIRWSATQVENFTNWFPGAQWEGWEGCHPVDFAEIWRENQLKLVVYPIVFGVSYIPGGAGFQPSTVSMCLSAYFPLDLFRSVQDLYFMAGQPSPAGPRTPPRNTTLWSGLINHWFPLIRPYISPYFWGG